MLEYDIESWHRKWKGCTGILKKPDGTIFQDYYEQIEHWDDTQYMAHLLTNGKHILRGMPVEGSDIKTAVPVYTPFESGVYHIKGVPLYRALVVKNHTKSFAVGMNAHTHMWYGYCVDTGNISPLKAWEIDLLAPIAVDPWDPTKPFGVLSKKVWWQHDRLMWLSKQLGFIKGNSIILDSEIYKPFIQQLVGPKCQLSVL